MDVRVGLWRKLSAKKIDAFELWCWGRLLKVLWTARISNQTILKEINPEYSLKDWCWTWSSNALATWSEGPAHWKRPWCCERLKAGGEGDDRGWDAWMSSLTHGHEFEQTAGDGEEQGSLVGCSPWGCKEGHDSETEQQQVVLWILFLLLKVSIFLYVIERVYSITYSDLCVFK